MPIGLLLNKYTAILAIVLALYGFYKFQEHQISVLKVDIETSEKNNKVLTDNITVITASVKNQQDMIDKTKKDMRRITILHNEMREREKQLDNKVVELKTKFDGKEKNENRLAELSMKKPGLVERLINKGSSNKMRCFEILTGSPLTEEESKPNYKNRECKELFIK